MNIKRPKNAIGAKKGFHISCRLWFIILSYICCIALAAVFNLVMKSLGVSNRHPAYMLLGWLFVGTTVCTFFYFLFNLIREKLPVVFKAFRIFLIALWSLLGFLSVTSFIYWLVTGNYIL